MGTPTRDGANSTSGTQVARKIPAAIFSATAVFLAVCGGGDINVAFRIEDHRFAGLSLASGDQDIAAVAASLFTGGSHLDIACGGKMTAAVKLALVVRLRGRPGGACGNGHHLSWSVKPECTAFSSQSLHFIDGTVAAVALTAHDITHVTHRVFEWRFHTDRYARRFGLLLHRLSGRIPARNDGNAVSGNIDMPGFAGGIILRSSGNHICCTQLDVIFGADDDITARGPHRTAGIALRRLCTLSGGFRRLRPDGDTQSRPAGEHAGFLRLLHVVERVGVGCCLHGQIISRLQCHIALRSNRRALHRQVVTCLESNVIAGKLRTFLKCVCFFMDGMSRFFTQEPAGRLFLFPVCIVTFGRRGKGDIPSGGHGCIACGIDIRCLRGHIPSGDNRRIPTRRDVSSLLTHRLVNNGFLA